MLGKLNENRILSLYKSKLSEERWNYTGLNDVWRWAPTSNDWRWTQKKTARRGKLCSWKFASDFLLSVVHFRTHENFLSELTQLKFVLSFPLFRWSKLRWRHFGVRNIALPFGFYARSSGLYSYHKNKTARIVFCCLHQSVELSLWLEWIQGSHKKLEWNHRQCQLADYAESS